jgi:hypothetical protein
MWRNVARASGGSSEAETTSSVSERAAMSPATVQNRSNAANSRALWRRRDMSAFYLAAHAGDAALPVDAYLRVSGTNDFQ